MTWKTYNQICRPYISKELRARILTDQNARCIYCGLRLIMAIHKRHDIVITKLNWDHLVPVSYRRNYNIVASCHICNQIKSDKIFDTLEDARKYIIHKRVKKGYFPASLYDEYEAYQDKELMYWNDLLWSH
jgi:hypothetical protein